MVHRTCVPGCKAALAGCPPDEFDSRASTTVVPMECSRFTRKGGIISGRTGGEDWMWMWMRPCKTGAGAAEPRPRISLKADESFSPPRQHRSFFCFLVLVALCLIPRLLLPVDLPPVSVKLATSSTAHCQSNPIWLSQATTPVLSRTTRCLSVVTFLRRTLSPAELRTMLAVWPHTTRLTHGVRKRTCLPSEPPSSLPSMCTVCL